MPPVSAPLTRVGPDTRSYPIVGAIYRPLGHLPVSISCDKTAGSKRPRPRVVRGHFIAAAELYAYQTAAGVFSGVVITKKLDLRRAGRADSTPGTNERTPSKQIRLNGHRIEAEHVPLQINAVQTGVGCELGHGPSSTEAEMQSNSNTESVPARGFSPLMDHPKAGGLRRAMETSGTGLYLTRPQDHFWDNCVEGCVVDSPICPGHTRQRV